MELTGVLRDYAPQIGFNFTKEQLIEDSQFDQILYMPWVGFPMQSRTDLTYAIGTIAFHPINFEQQNRSINELVVNYDGVVSKGRGLHALPLEIGSGLPVSASTADFQLANTCVWVSKEERLSLLNGYNEIIFREYAKCGELTVQPMQSDHKVSIDLSIKGPTTFIFMSIAARKDTDSGNWTKLCNDNGLDYIKSMMLITGTTAREDGMPSSFYRTAKILETFKRSIDRHVYLLSFSTDETSTQFKGHQSLTNVDKISLVAEVFPHADTLDFAVYSSVLNGAYTERGGGGKIWG